MLFDLVYEMQGSGEISRTGTHKDDIHRYLFTFCHTAYLRGNSSFKAHSVKRKYIKIPPSGTTGRASQSASATLDVICQMRPLNSPLILIFLLLVMLLTGCSHHTVNPKLSKEMPQKIVWAWERPEDLRSLDPANFGVAFLAQTLFLENS